MRAYLGAAFLAVAVLIGGAGAHEVSEGGVKIEHPRVNPTPNGAKTGAAYMKIVNEGKEPLEIKAMSTPVADKVEVHTMTMTGDVMRMRPVEMPLKIAPGDKLDLNRDRHIMLIGLKKPLAKEEMVSFKIEFANGKTMEFDLYVEAASDHAAGAAHHDH